jgi:hypothetical protein
MDHNNVRCRYDTCQITSPLTVGLCSKHFALAVEFDLLGELATDQPIKRYKPYVPKATLFGRRAPQGMPLAFLRQHATYDGKECVIWPFARARNGYPEVQFQGRSARAHRLMCRFAHGDPPEKHYEASHTCENGHLGCVNPKHLVWETHAENHGRRASKPVRRDDRVA